MIQEREPNLFTRKQKLLAGLPLLAVAIVFVAYDPELYIGVVGFLTLPVALAFPALYMTMNWKKTVLGRALMTKARAVALLYLIGLLGKIYPYPFHGYLMAAVVTYLFLALTFQLTVFIRVKMAAAPKHVERRHRHGQSDSTGESVPGR